MPINWYMYFVAALTPFFLGAIYYGPLLGKPWMKINGFTEEDLKKGSPAVIFGVSYLFCVLLSFFLSNVAIHQTGIFGTFMPDVLQEGSQAQEDFRALMSNYGDRHRSFGHGAGHGIFFAIFCALPLIGVNALFERRGFKYIFLHWGYWLITSVLVCGLLCATIEFTSI